MAKGRSTRRGSIAAGAATAPSADNRDRIIDAALHLAAEHGWRRLSLGEIAAEAGLPILDVYRTFGSRTAILLGFFRRIDETVLAAPPEAEADEHPRDRVFDLLMRRFDALQPYRGAITALTRDVTADPCTALALAAKLLRSITWTLEAGGIPTGGLGGAVAVRLTTAAYLATSRVWRTDETPDLGPTMAELDRRLRGIERWLGAPRRRTTREAPEAA